MSLIKDVAAEIAALDTSKRSLNRFLTLMIIIWLIIFMAGYYFDYQVLFITGIAFCALLVSGLLIQPFGTSVYKGWMGFSFTMGWLVSRVLLFIIFFLLVTPIALIARLSGKRFLDTGFKKERASYWIKKDETPVDYTKMS